MQLEHLRSLFTMYDRDQSGSITADELRDVLSACGSTQNQDVVHEVMRFSDKTGDGMIDFPEFVFAMCRDLVTHQLISKPMSRFAEVFNKYDLDGNGEMSLTEFKCLFSSNDVPLPASVRQIYANDLHKVDKLFSQGDRDKNHQVLATISGLCAHPSLDRLPRVCRINDSCKSLNTAGIDPADPDACRFLSFVLSGALFITHNKFKATGCTMHYSLRTSRPPNAFSHE